MSFIGGGFSLRRLLCGLGLLACTYVQAEQACRQVVISAHPYYPPFHWQQDGVLTGASIEISKEIFKRLGVKAEVSLEGPWKRVLKAAKDGKVDFIPALKNSPERNQYLSFTPTAFHYNPVAVFMRASDKLSVDSLEQLSGLFGSISLGDKHGEEIDTFINSQPNMQKIKGLEANFKMLLLDRTDYFIGGYYTGLDHLHGNRMKHQIRVAKVFEQTEVHNAFAKNSHCHYLLADFDQQLQGLVKQGKVGQIIQKYEKRWLESKTIEAFN